MTMNTGFDQEMNRETTVDKAEDAASKAQQKVSETATAAKEQAKRAASQVTDQAKTTVDSRMTDVAEDLGSVAEVVRQTSQEVGSGNNDTITHYGERIADQIEGISNYLNENGIDDVLNDLQSFARRQPAVFLGGAFMLGMFVGRFLRSSSSRNYGYQQGDYGYQSGNYGYSSTGYSQYGSDYPGGSQRPTTGSGSYPGQQQGQQGQNRYQTGFTQESTTSQE